MTKYQKKIAKAKRFNRKLSIKEATRKASPSSQKYFHYSVLPHLPQILTSGILKRELSPSEVYGKIKREYPEHNISREDINYIPALWFSTNPLWENTAHKRRDEKFGISAQSEFYQLIRYQINPEAVRLDGWEKYSIENEKHAIGLKRAAKPMKGNPEEWFYTYNDVPLHEDNFLSFGLYYDEVGAWINFPFKVESLQNICIAFQDEILQAS